MISRRALSACVPALCLAARTGHAADGDDAEAAARDFLAPWFRAAPDGTQLSYDYLSVPMMGDWTKTFWQYRSMGWKVAASPLDEADRLNGFTWVGCVELAASAVRKLTENRRPLWGTVPERVCWYSWLPGESAQMPTWRLVRKDGAWRSYRTSSELTKSLYGPGETPITDDDMARVLGIGSCR